MLGFCLIFQQLTILVFLSLSFSMFSKIQVSLRIIYQEKKMKHWISALRPRTLFLAIATALCGNGLAYSSGKFSRTVFFLTLAIAVILQFLANLANDLGDYQHGTDTTGERLGPTRTVQSGAITPRQMKTGIGVCVGLAMAVGLGLIYVALQFMNPLYMILFVSLGGLSIVAAIKYTAGDNPYGYKALGDIFSFLFFGLVAVVGTYFLHVHALDFKPWLPAIGLGFLTAAVLNVNNMRDRANDLKSGKITLAIKLGYMGTKHYHAFLTIATLVCFVIYNICYTSEWYQWLYLILFAPLLRILINIYRNKDDKALDPYLKYTSMCTFFLSLAFVFCINMK